MTKRRGQREWAVRYFLRSGKNMSRIGQQPIELPSGVTVNIKDRAVEVKGPKGTLSFVLPAGILVAQKENSLNVQPEHKDSKKALWGTVRAVIANMVEGVHKGFEKRLEIHGVGYRAQVKGDTLELLVGFSHPVLIKAPDHVSFAVEKNLVTVSGIDKAQVGEVAANIRKVRKPEPYKGKGIRYEGETVRRKAGKKAATGA